jgi:hypothetical protein
MRAWYVVLGVCSACDSLGLGEIELTCREPDVEIWTAEGVEAALCDLSFLACEDGSYLTVSCTNETFGGEYACDWIRIDGSRSQAGEFESPDLCTLDPEGMIEEINAQSELEIRVE